MLIPPQEFQKYKKVQEIAKTTIEYLKTFIETGITERQIAEEAEKFFRQNGIDSFWYYGIAALVYVGERTTLSVSGLQYQATDTKVKAEDIVTVDLSPTLDDCWGDFARTFIVQDGKVEENFIPSGMKEGLQREEELHKALQKMLKEDMTFHYAYVQMNQLIEHFGFENLDLHKNLGHTIEKNKVDRKYIEYGNMTEFKDVKFFTFEPHIRRIGGKFGFKREDIYYFEDGKLQIL